MDLIAAAATLADRLSANIELPTSRSLQLLAPEKNERQILQIFDAAKQQQSLSRQVEPRRPISSVNPAGMSTQMIIGATRDNDLTILRRADRLYRDSGLKRVYYSAYIPVNSDNRLPALAGPPLLLREHRIYQADWLLRFYQFNVDEILDPAQPQLDPDLDPKASWALRHLEHFPLDVNKASRRELLRVPGIGVRSMQRILRARRHGRLNSEDLGKLGVVMKRARYFLHDGRYYLGDVPQREDFIRTALTSEQRKKATSQLSFNFSASNETAASALTGEL